VRPPMIRAALLPVLDEIMKGGFVTLEKVKVID
jgi:hypothetical protein